MMVIIDADRLVDEELHSAELLLPSNIVIVHKPGAIEYLPQDEPSPLMWVMSMNGYDGCSVREWFEPIEDEL